jgi:sugar phosphate isomerase/epimerase
MQIRLGVQAFGLKRELEENTSGTLKQIKEIGFDIFEPIIMMAHRQVTIPNAFSSMETFPEMVRMIKESGLVCESCHVHGSKETSSATAAKFIQRAYEISGIRRYVFSGNLKSKEDAVQCAGFLNGLLKTDIKNLAEIIYHNHCAEFNVIQREDTGEAEYVLDYFLRLLDPAIKLEIDFGWAWYGNVQFSSLKKYFNRLEIIHLKDFYPCVDKGPLVPVAADRFAPIGEGEAYQKEVLAAIPEMPVFSGIVILDQDTDPFDMIEAERKGYINVNKILQKMSQRSL